MRKKPLIVKETFVVSILLVVSTIVFGTFYTYWNTAEPTKTCASCHEINSSVETFSTSAHATLQCSKCHGTALSNGFHSLKEKGMMVVNHVRSKNQPDIAMNENQVLAVMENCVKCHSAEHAAWLSGGHSVTYKDILLHTKHNQTELLNFDCLRCHGMFSDVNITELVKPIDKTGPWNLVNGEMASKPAIPCLACHQVHRRGITKIAPGYANPKQIFYARTKAEPKAGFYNRHDKTYISAENLPQLKLWNHQSVVTVSDDPLMRICVQCHAPNAWHQAGTGDDKTPLGVHEGLSCIACHDAHSNNAQKSCARCHPAISNCNLDVTTMNTSFADSLSKNDIHTVACADCHKNEKPKKN